MVRLLVENSYILVSLLGKMNRTAESEYASSDNDNRRVFLRQRHIKHHLCIPFSPLPSGLKSQTRFVTQGFLLWGSFVINPVEDSIPYFPIYCLLPTTIMGGMDHGI